MKPRPGIGATPAVVCVATTITERGHTKQSRVLRSSGNAQADFRALRFARKLRLVSPDGEASAKPVRAERAATLLIRMHQNGRFAFRTFEAEEPLPEICAIPASE